MLNTTRAAFRNYAFGVSTDASPNWTAGAISQIVGFSAERLRLQSRETGLNTAIIAISKQDFAMTNFELSPLFFKFLGRYYSEDFVFWLGSEVTPGKAAAFERLADILEPLYTLLQLGVTFVDSVIAHPTFQDREGNFVTYWEAVLGGTYGTSIPQKLKDRPCMEEPSWSRSTS